MNNPIHVKFQEGSHQNYFDGFREALGGGETTKDSFYARHSGTSVKIDFFTQLEELSMYVFQMESNKDMIIERTPDNDPEYFHLNIIREGAHTQKYHEKAQNITAGSPQGVFLYNGMFPISLEFPAPFTYKVVSFKFHLNKLSNLFSVENDALRVLFENEGSALAYHTKLSREVGKLTDDILFYNSDVNLQKPMVLSRGIEAFSNMVLSLKKLYSEDALAGLHMEDYQRLQKIKAKLTQSFDENITIDGLADEFYMTPSKLRRDFKQLFRMSVYQFYTHARMDEAYRRLKSGKFTVSDVGLDLGYQNLSKFSEMFKKIKGVLPKEVIKVI